MTTSRRRFLTGAAAGAAAAGRLAPRPAVAQPRPGVPADPSRSACSPSGPASPPPSARPGSGAPSGGPSA